MTTMDMLEKELLILLSEQVESLKDVLANGNASSFEDYQRNVGVISGIRYAIDAVADARKTVNSKYM
jgi:hypothetical protein